MSAVRLRCYGLVPDEGQNYCFVSAVDDAQVISAGESSRVKEERITAIEARFDAIEQRVEARFDAIEQRFEQINDENKQRFDDITKLLNTWMNKVSGSEEKSNTIPETSSPTNNHDGPKVSFEEPKVTPPQTVVERFKVEPAEAALLTTLKEIQPEIFLEDQLVASCTRDTGTMKYNPMFSRPDSITSSPKRMTFEERIAWLKAAKWFCTRTQLRTDQWVSFLIDEFFSDSVTIYGIRDIIFAHISTTTYYYIADSWFALILYFFPSRIEIEKHKFLKDHALRTKWIKKGENIAQSLRTWLIACQCPRGYGPSFREVKLQLEIILFEVAPNYIVDFSKITNWTELISVLDEGHFPQFKCATEDIVIFKDHWKGATFMSTMDRTQFHAMAEYADVDYEDNEQLNIMRHSKGNSNGNFRSSNPRGNGNARSYNNNKSNHGNSYCGSTGQGGSGSYNRNSSVSHHDQDFKIYDGCECYRCRQYKQMATNCLSEYLERE
ncbi:unnamed protein product [Cyberlindnera jadinii]|uniref:Uncharacterized protein n=1 Tax=Cyberlindnera jadinii (strain ATCC 18201 / CBS 1600 / BCRC 20928 / JCM 3617 / NBRC 0987 / NRRL Y-1542) TaxID=983966 RepID=A0A0H5CK67_CYBJN|nr:unnamed protein product [Cyberlindnera jadinii]